MDKIQQNILTYFKQYKQFSFHKGDTIIHAGDPPSGVFYLEKGHVRVYAVSKEGVELTIHIFTPGSFFPMMWALDDIPNRYYYEAIDEVELWRAPKLDVLNFIKSEPEVLFDLTQRIFKGIDKMAMRVERLMFSTARIRVISVLVMLARHFGERKNIQVTITHPFTHRDIASLAGLTRETASRQLELLTKDNLIVVDRHTIILKDIKQLEHELSTYDVSENTEYMYR